MPGVLQVEALAQTMAVYVAKQPGFGDRIGLFAGIDEVRFSELSFRRHAPARDHDGEAWLAVGKGRGVATVDGEVACEELFSSSSRPRTSCDEAGLVSGVANVHGNLSALEARASHARSAAYPDDVVMVAGDLVLKGPDPAAVVDGLREFEASGALIVQGNTDIAVADFDYSAAFPSSPTVSRTRSWQPPSGPTRKSPRAGRLAATTAGRAARPDRR